LNRVDVSAALQRAAEISRELAAQADAGDVQGTQRLDAERLQLLKSVNRTEVLNPNDRALLREIAELNERAIGILEHRRRITGRQIDMAAVGRRAVLAYAVTR
jgi:hypothetical protein